MSPGSSGWVLEGRDMVREISGYEQRWRSLGECKKDYIAQMMVWLWHQEAVDRFSTYLEWYKSCTMESGWQDCGTEHGLELETEGDEQDGEVIIENLPISDVDTASASETANLSDSNATSFSHTSMRHIPTTHPPHLHRIPASKIISDQHASLFLQALTTYICTPSNLYVPKSFDTFDLFSRLVLRSYSRGNGSEGLRPQLVCCAPFPSIAPYFRMLYVSYPKIRMANVAYPKVRTTIVWYPGIEESNIFLSKDKE